MKQCRNRRRRSKGYTLVELIVAMSVAAVLFVSMVSIMAPIYRVFGRTRERTDAQLVAGAVLDSVRAACANAQSLTASGDGGVLYVDGSAAFSLSPEGYLLFDNDTADAQEPDLLLASGVYNGKTLSFFCAQRGDAVVVTICVLAKEEALAEVTTTIRSLRSVLD